MDDDTLLKLIATAKATTDSFSKQSLVDMIRDELVNQGEYDFLIPDLDGLEKWIKSTA